jgi:hypothetical protein
MNTIRLGISCMICVLLSACQPAPKASPAALELDRIVLPTSPPFGLRIDSLSTRMEPAGNALALDEIRNLTSRRRANLVGRAGWLHIQTRITRGGVDPLAAAAPGLAAFDQEEWLNLDAQGRATQALQRFSVDGGPVREVRRLRDGVWQDLTRRSQSAGEEGAAFDPDYGFYALALQLTTQGYALNKSLLYKECWYQGEKYTISDGRRQHEAVYNTGYGQLRWLKTWQIDSQGQITLVDSREILLEERVSQPPEDVLAELRPGEQP